MIIDGWQLEMAKAVDRHKPKPYQYAYLFVKNNQVHLADAFMNTYQAITDILDQQNINYGVLVLISGHVVFTETALDLNPTITKLATGINFEGEIDNMRYQVERANRYIIRENKSK